MQLALSDVYFSGSSTCPRLAHNINRSGLGYWLKYVNDLCPFELELIHLIVIIARA